MSDYCRQCSILMFGKDFGELAGEGRSTQLCEGCGAIRVDAKGRCLDHTDHEHMVFILGADYVAKLDKDKITFGRWVEKTVDKDAQGHIEGRLPHPSEDGNSD